MIRVNLLSKLKSLIQSPFTSTDEVKKEHITIITDAHPGMIIVDDNTSYSIIMHCLSEGAGARQAVEAKR